MAQFEYLIIAVLTFAINHHPTEAHLHRISHKIKKSLDDQLNNAKQDYFEQHNNPSEKKVIGTKFTIVEQDLLLNGHDGNIKSQYNKGMELDLGLHSNFPNTANEKLVNIDNNKRESGIAVRKTDKYKRNAHEDNFHHGFYYYNIRDDRHHYRDSYDHHHHDFSHHDDFMYNPPSSNKHGHGHDYGHAHKHDNWHGHKHDNWHGHGNWHGHEHGNWHGHEHGHWNGHGNWNGYEHGHGNHHSHGHEHGYEPSHGHKYGHGYDHGHDYGHGYHHGEGHGYVHHEKENKTAFDTKHNKTIENHQVVNNSEFQTEKAIINIDNEENKTLLETDETRNDSVISVVQNKNKTPIIELHQQGNNNEFQENATEGVTVDIENMENITLVETDGTRHGYQHEHKYGDGYEQGDGHEHHKFHHEEKHNVKQTPIIEGHLEGNGSKNETQISMLLPEVNTQTEKIVNSTFFAPPNESQEQENNVSDLTLGPNVETRVNKYQNSTDQHTETFENGEHTITATFNNSGSIDQIIDIIFPLPPNENENLEIKVPDLSTGENGGRNNVSIYQNSTGQYIMETYENGTEVVMFIPEVITFLPEFITFPPEVINETESQASDNKVPSPATS